MSITLPKSQTGIKKSLVIPYTGDDLNWRCWSKPSDPHHGTYLKFDYLMNKAVQVGNLYYVRDKATDVWISHQTSKTARKQVFQFYSGSFNTGSAWVVIANDDIEHYFQQGIPTLAGTIYAPGVSDLVIYKGEKRLNVYRDMRLAGDTDHIPNCEEMLKVIRNSLCAAPDELPLQDMIDEIRSQQQTPFRWVMHWLAARYQLPGFAPQTNLWFVGRRGTGKGTLIQLMTEVLGGSTVGKASKDDIAKGWTDCFLGKQLMEWDEFKCDGGWHQFRNLLKEKTGNTEITINQRNVGSSQHPAVTMHIFASNEDKPILVEDDDRQNTMIETVAKTAVGDHWVYTRVKNLFDTMTGEFADTNMASGFAALLNEIAIDVGFVRTPLETPKRLYLKSVSADTVRKWVEEAGADDYGRSTYDEWEDVHSRYVDWTRARTHQRPEDLTGFKGKMIEHGFASNEPRRVKRDGQAISRRVCVFSLPVVSPPDEEETTNIARISSRRGR